MKIAGREVKWTAIAVLLFIVAFMWGRYAESAEFGVGLGVGMFNAVGGVVQEVSLHSDDQRWFVSAARIGGDDAENIRAVQNTRYVLAYRVFWRRDKNWQPYLSLGPAYFDTPPERVISDRWTYDLRMGLRFKDIVEFDIDQHNSTAGRSVRNTGFDAFMLRAVFRF